MPEKYEYIVAAIEESKDLSTLSIQQLMISCSSHEERNLQRGGNSVESSFQSKLSFRAQKPSMNQGNFKGGSRTLYNIIKLPNIRIFVRYIAEKISHSSVSDFLLALALNILV